jgi:GTPase SAR1 family protein
MHDFTARPQQTRVLTSVLQVRVNLWDLAGSPDYVEVRNEFYKDSQAAILVRAADPTGA